MCSSDLSNPRSPSVEPSQTDLFLFPPIQSGLKTPERKPDAARSVPDPTPLALKSSILRKLQPEMDKNRKYYVIRYEQYIIQDFERHRVFVDIDVFMKNVLHVPDDWKELWKTTINDIKADQAFTTPYFRYCAECEVPGGQETRFYEHLVDMSNAILDFSTDSSDESVKPRTPQRYLRNDPKTISCGIITELSPDIVAVHQDFLANGGSGSNLSWAQPLQAMEVKPRDGALVDGSCMPRLMVNGERATTSVAMRF